MYALSLAMAITLMQPRAEGARDAADAHCGAYCVFISALALGLEPGSFEDFLSVVGPPEPGGYTMEQLADAARLLGLQAVGVEAGVERLLELPRPFCCMALMNDHYVTVQDLDAVHGVVHVIDPPRSGKVSLNAFQLDYSGKMLLLSKSTLGIGARPGSRLNALLAIVSGMVVCARGGALAWWNRDRIAQSRKLVLGASLLLPLQFGGCSPEAVDRRPAVPGRMHQGTALRAEPPLIALGKILVDLPDQVVDAGVDLWNDGREPVQIAAVRKSCACTSATLNATTIAPGGKARLSVRIKVGNRTGPRQSVVTVESANEATPDASVAFSWDAETRLSTEPGLCNVGRLDPSKGASIRLALHASGLLFCPDCRLTAESNHGLLAAKASIGSKILRRGHEPKESHLGGSPAADVGAVEIEVAPGGEAGDYSQGVDLSLHCGTTLRSTLFIPVEWSCRPSVELNPSRLWLGVCRPGQAVDKQVVVNSTEARPFRIVGVSCDPPSLLRSSRFEGGEGMSHMARLGFQVDARIGIQRGTLSFELDGVGMSRLTLPVSCLVRQPEVGSEEPEGARP